MLSFTQFIQFIRNISDEWFLFQILLPSTVIYWDYQYQKIYYREELYTKHCEIFLIEVGVKLQQAAWKQSC